MQQRKNLNVVHVQLVVLSKILYLTQTETSKIVKLQAFRYPNELLNHFKLSLYDWDELKAHQFYEDDSFCFDCCLNMPQFACHFFK